MQKFVESAGLSRRKLLSQGLTLCVLLGVCMSGISSAAAQSSQSFAVNRALVSSGPAAAPPVAPAPRPLANVQPPQTPALILLTKVLGSVQPLKVLSDKQGGFGLVGVHPGQLIDVTIQYPVTKTVHRISAEALDGGQVLVQGPMLVGLDSSVHFQFRADRSPGVNHITLRDGPRELGLQFWVIDEQHPERNPPGLTMAN